MNKRTQWKWMALGLAALMGLSGCGGATEAKSNLKQNDPTKITIWNYYSGAQLEEFNALVNEFNASKGADLGIVVESYSQGNIGELTDTVMAAANKEVGAQDLPNIFAAYSDTVARLDGLGIISDIGSYFSDEEREEYIPSYLNEGDIDGNGGIKIFPVAKATEILMLNETDWEKFASACDLDTDALATMEGLTETAQKYYEWTDAQTEEPDDGKAFFGRDAVANYMIIGLRELGVEVLTTDADGKTVLQFPEEQVRKLWDNYYVPFINGYFTASGKFRSDDVKTGNAICFVGSSSSASFFPQEVILSDTEKYPIDVEVLKAPVFAEGDAYAVQQGAGMAVVQASDAEIEASVEFLKWFTEEEPNIRFSIASGYMPVKKAANDMEKIEEQTDVSGDVVKALKASLDTVNDSTMYTLGGKSGDVRNILENSISDQAVADREAVVAEMKSGASRADAVAAYDTDENFQNWYQMIAGQLQEAVDQMNGDAS